MLPQDKTKRELMSIMLMRLNGNKRKTTECSMNGTWKLSNSTEISPTDKVKLRLNSKTTRVDGMKPRLKKIGRRLRNIRSSLIFITDNWKTLATHLREPPNNTTTPRIKSK